MSCNPQDNSLETFLRENEDLHELRQHRGNDGPPGLLYKPDENKLYVYYDGNDFNTTREDLFTGTIYEGSEAAVNHVFRDLWVATLELPLSKKVAGVRVTQDGKDVPAGSLYDFGPIQVGSNSTATFTVENNRDQELTLSSIDVSTDQFSLDVPYSFPAPIEPHGMLTFNVTFAPTVAGRQAAQVATQFNGSASYPYTFTVSGGREQLYLPLILHNHPSQSPLSYFPTPQFPLAKTAAVADTIASAKRSARGPRWIRV
jgi:hypothetical protein